MDTQVATVIVRRQWNDYRAATYRLSDVSGWHWSNESGGVAARSPRLFVSAYVMCNAMMDGELAHSCRHGPPPHEIKVVLLKKDNLAIWPEVLAKAGERPESNSR